MKTASSELQRVAEEAIRNENRLARWRIRHERQQHRRTSHGTENLQRRAAP